MSPRRELITLDNEVLANNHCDQEILNSANILVNFLLTQNRKLKYDIQYEASV